nr:MAG TPA: hypothetical protein [Caudoviricetes sp.]
MTEAEKLLQETKSAAVVAESQAEDICVIDSDLRIIGIPEQFKVLGVENDKDVKVMQFRMPKVYKGTDLSAFNISVNYQNARGTKDRYVVTDKKVSGDQIEFSWTVGKTATVYRGDTRFIVCMRLTGSDGIIQKEFNTTLATMTVLEGLEVDNPVIEQEEKDIIAQLLQVVDDKSKEAVQAVTAEGAKQIKAVQDAAQDAAQEVIADREQIKTNKADIADLRQTKAGAIINSARGERIAVGDSADAFFEGLKLYGKSEQNGSPTPDNPIPIKICGDSGNININIGTENPQTLSIPTPNGLPGIKVDSGGNYTDSNGQQRVCDEMDFKRGKYVQRGFKKIVLNGTENWSYNSGNKTFTVTGTQLFPDILNKKGFCTHFRLSENKLESLNNDEIYAIYTSQLYLRCDKFAGNVEEFKNWLSSNAVSIIYLPEKRKTIETDIPAETITACQKLYTNYPSTVIQNDSGAGMEVEYVADTKQFILDQIKALVQA